MPKKLSEKQKEEIVKLFTSGKTINELSKDFNFTKLTIIRNLKKNLGEKKFEELNTKIKLENKFNDYKEKKKSIDNKDELNKKSNNEKLSNRNLEEELPYTSPFIEITPLDWGIDNEPQKDLCSISISDMNFPKIVYMVVDKKIELETKYLKEYPEWQFLSEEELNRVTIEIYNDLKIAKRFCNKEQKVIKVPNTDVFKIVSRHLIAKGITRIVSSDKLIAL